MSDYQYTTNWFKWAPQVWEQLIPYLPARKNFLEIGSFEGRSAVWITQHMMEDGGELVCIDTWEGGEEHTAEDMAGSEARFHNNIGLVMGNFVDRKVLPVKSTSVEALGGLTGHWGGELDTFYANLAQRVLEYQATPPAQPWTGFIVKS